MVEIMRVGLPAVLSPLVLAGNRISGPPAGEDIVAGDACYLTGDGRAYRSIGAAPDEAADVRGFAAASVRRGHGRIPTRGDGGGTLRADQRGVQRAEHEAVCQVSNRLSQGRDRAGPEACAGRSGPDQRQHHQE